LTALRFMARNCIREFHLQTIEIFVGFHFWNFLNLVSPS
jgi:hypothetical protein